MALTSIETALDHGNPTVAVQAYFSDGITSDIITELARFRSMFVIARHSSFAYRNKAVAVQRIGWELGVHYVVEASVSRADDRIRVSAELIDAQAACARRACRNRLPSC